MNWKQISDGIPECDVLCLVVNENRPFSFYVAYFDAYSKEFDLYVIGLSRAYDAIPFKATHYIPIPSLQQE